MSLGTRKKDDHSSSAHVKLRWMELDVEGGTTDLVEGLKSFATALGRGTFVAPLARPIAAHRPSSSASAAVVDTAIPQDDRTDEAVIEAVDEVLSETRNGDASDRPKRRAAPKAPKFLNELDLTKANVPLTDFVRQKNPDGDMDKYAVIAVWYKAYFTTEEITIDHVFTAYKTLGWQAQLPRDPSQTFRNLKSNKNWFDSGSKRGAYKINWNGEDAVNKMGVVKS